MYLENLVMDAADPQRLGRFWEAALGGERLTDEPDVFETRIAVEGGPVLDLCLQRVPEEATEPPRLHLDVAGGAQQEKVVKRLLELGAAPLDVGQGNVPWVVLADLEINPFLRARGAGPVHRDRPHRRAAARLGRSRAGRPLLGVAHRLGSGGGR